MVQIAAEEAWVAAWARAEVWDRDAAAGDAWAASRRAVRWAPAGVPIAAIRSRMNEAFPARRFSVRSARHRWFGNR